MSKSDELARLALQAKRLKFQHGVSMGDLMMDFQKLAEENAGNKHRLTNVGTGIVSCRAQLEQLPADHPVRVDVEKMLTMFAQMIGMEK